MGLRRFGHPLRRLPPARPAARRVREARRRGRGPPPDRHRAARSRCTSRGTPSPTTTSCAPRSSRAACASARSTRTSSRTPTTSSARSRTRTPRVREKAVAHMLECLEIATALGATAQSLWLADGTNYPGQDDLRERRHRMLDCLAARLRRAARRAGVPGRVQVLRARLLRDRPGRLGQRAADLPEAGRAREGPGRPRPPRAGHEHRADRRLPGRRGPARRLPLQQPQVRRRRPDRRLGEPVRAVPDLRRADRVRRAAAADDRPVAQHRGARSRR